MRSVICVATLLSFLTSYVSATALTYRMTPNEKSCFYAWVEEKGVKVAFYFAVQTGGSFDIDYRVSGPGDYTVIDGQKERQGDFVFTANDVGEYAFCFDNGMSSVSDKTVDFEVAIENESRASLPSKPGAPAEQTSNLQESVYKLSGQLSTISRNQKYFRTRENRNFSTVRSTEQRIFRFSVIENIFMVGVAGLQVFIVRYFFTSGRKGGVL